MGPSDPLLSVMKNPFYLDIECAKSVPEPLSDRFGGDY